jgi:hypothetical protein
VDRLLGQVSGSFLFIGRHLRVGGVFSALLATPAPTQAVAPAQSPPSFADTLYEEARGLKAMTGPLPVPDLSAPRTYPDVGRLTKVRTLIFILVTCIFSSLDFIMLHPSPCVHFTLDFTYMKFTRLFSVTLDFMCAKFSVLHYWIWRVLGSLIKYFIDLDPS